MTGLKERLRAVPPSQVGPASIITFCFIALSHYAIYRSASEKQLSCIMIILSYFVAIGREWVRVCRCRTQHLCWENGGRGG